MLFEVVGDVEIFHSIADSLSQILGCPSPHKVTDSYLNSATPRCVPGVDIPQHIIDRLDKAADPLHEGMAIAAEQVRSARELCQGVHMMAVRREDLIPQILEMAGVEPQVKREPVEVLSAVG